MPCLSQIFEGVQHASRGSGAETKSLAPDLVLSLHNPFLEPGYSCLPPGALPAACVVSVKAQQCGEPSGVRQAPAALQQTRASLCLQVPHHSLQSSWMNLLLGTPFLVPPSVPSR